MKPFCTNPGEYAGGVGEAPRKLDKAVGTFGNKLFTPCKGEEHLYCRKCYDEGVRRGEIW